ncbi:hypothetical protein [Aquimarina hainanensis]
MSAIDAMKCNITANKPLHYILTTKVYLKYKDAKVDTVRFLVGNF